MKRILCLLITLTCIVGVFCGCNSLNQKPVTLADSINIPENGIISADIFTELKQENKAVSFIGESKDIRYKWVIFSSDVKNAKDLNLGIEITEATDERLAFRFLSKENFGFSPVLSIYLNDVWSAQSATLTTDVGEKQQVTVTGKNQIILNFSPKVQTGAILITPDSEQEDMTSPKATETEPVPDNSSAVSSEPPSTSSPTESKQPISNGENTKQDKYKTDPIPKGKPHPAEPESQTVDTKKSYTCTFSIECSSILNNLTDLEPDKLDILPKNGVIFAPQTVTFYEGESVYDLLKRICSENQIHMEASWTPMYNSAYVEGIGNLYEFDCGSGSGWMYRVDGWYPNYGCSRYQLKQGDTVEWRYTCDLGKDIGGSNAIG